MPLDASSAFFSSFALRDTYTRTCFEKCRAVGYTAGYCNNWNVKCGNADVNCFARGVCSTKDVNACLASTGMNYCAMYGKTLCGSSDGARCQGTGCYYNSIYQWTNEPCEPGDEGYECTAA